MSLKKIVFLLLCSCLLIGAAHAYIVTLSVPRSVSAGDTIAINGSSNLPSGLSTTITLSKVGAIGLIDEKDITIQEGGVFTTSFNAGNLEKGTYKIEIMEKNDYPYGSGSVEWVFVDVIDRRNEISLIAPLTQPFDGSLIISGSISTIGDSGLRISVEKGGTIVFGPEYIKTSTEGMFETEIPIPDDGMYTVTLIDNTSYRWTVKYNAIPLSQTTQPTTVTTTLPAPTTATMPASRNEPAFFRVTSGQGVMRAYTSEGVDWVMEYIDETGAQKKINVRGTAAEEVTLAVSGGTIYFKIYPDRYDDRATVTLSVENARTIEPCTTCAGLFEAGTTPTEATPLPLFLAIFAMLCVIALRKLS
ncbi:MAG: hypothetical protein LUO82_06185 [Methanomicrobiales archaeon]|nr:hypothetical protein [Methanomicrobiales archaeon]